MVAIHMSKHGKKRAVIVKNFLLALFAILFTFGAIMTGRYFVELRQAYSSNADIQQRVWTSTTTIANIQSGTTTGSLLDFALLQNINPEIKAWLCADGTDIDYPVLQAGDNSYYLSHLYTGESNNLGSLFLDYRNTGVFTDRNTVIYGHNRQDGVMFSLLEAYKEQDYYDSHPTMKLYTPSGDYTIELVCGTIESGNYEFIQLNFADDAAFLEYVESCRDRSCFQSNVEVQPQDRIVSLCTCSYEWNNARFMVIGKLTPVVAGE